MVDRAHVQSEMGRAHVQDGMGITVLALGEQELVEAEDWAARVEFEKALADKGVTVMEMVLEDGTVVVVADCGMELLGRAAEEVKLAFPAITYGVSVLSYVHVFSKLIY